MIRASVPMTMPNSERHETTLALIRNRLQETLAPIHLQIIDESARHAGHQGARAGGGHFAMVIVAAAFEGRPAVARHRAIYEALGREMGASIHALAITALAPSEWRAEAAPKQPGED